MSPLSRRHVLGLAIASVFVTRSRTRAADAKRPNILFILADDQRPDTIAALGNPNIQTPNLDKLVARGTAFTRAHIMGGTGGAVCVSSRAGIMTGRTLWHVPDAPKGEHAFWPATFAKEGYRTFQTGKWHNGPASLNLAFQDSRNTFFGGMTDHNKVKLWDYSADGKYSPAKARVGEKYDGEIFADTAVDFIRKQNAERPWFCWVSFTNPHDPRTPPGAYATMYDPAKVPLPRNFMSTPPVETGVLDIRDEKLLPYPRDEGAVRKEIAAYYGTISHLDAQVGRILDTLRETGQEESTIVIYAGDNGLALGSHGLLGKQNVYEHSDGVPLIMAGPGVPRGTRSDALVYLLDLFATTCEMTGIPAPATVEGKSFAPVFKGQPAPRQTLFSAYTKLHRMVRDDRWKLIEWHVKGNQRVQLFDLKTDADELTDLAEEKTHKPDRKRLEKLMRQYQTELGDPLLKG
jgi:arylsulfatase A-like enzyme